MIDEETQALIFEEGIRKLVPHDLANVWQNTGVMLKNSLRVADCHALNVTCNFT